MSERLTRVFDPIRKIESYHLEYLLFVMRNDPISAKRDKENYFRTASFGK